jgi:small subunit ribosomal protein S16
VAVKIKLKRLGKIRAPHYRIVVADARTKRDGRAIEEIGKYHPKAEPSFIEVDSERAQHWLSVGAQPTDPVRKILEITGDWQRFKGLPGTEGTLQMAAPKQDRKEIFAAAVSETLADGGAAAKGRARAKSADTARDDSPGGKAGRAAAGQAKAEKPARGQAKAAPDADGPDGKTGDARAEGSKTAGANAADAASAADAKAGDGRTAAGEADAEPAAAAPDAQANAGEPADADPAGQEADAKAAAAEPDAQAPESGA